MRSVVLAMALVSCVSDHATFHITRAVGVVGLERVLPPGENAATGLAVCGAGGVAEIEESHAQYWYVRVTCVASTGTPAYPTYPSR